MNFSLVCLYFRRLEIGEVWMKEDKEEKKWGGREKKSNILCFGCVYLDLDVKYGRRRVLV